VISRAGPLVRRRHYRALVADAGGVAGLRRGATVSGSRAPTAGATSRPLNCLGSIPVAR